MIYLSTDAVLICTVIMAAIAVVMTFKEDSIVNGVINFINKIGK